MKLYMGYIGHECFGKCVVFWLLILLVAEPNQKQQQEYLV